MAYPVCLLAVLGSQGIVVKCAAAIFFCSTVDSMPSTRTPRYNKLCPVIQLKL